MDKKQKIKELKDRLAKLSKKSTFDDSSIENLTNSLVDEQVSRIKKDIQDNPTLKALAKIQAEIARFKKDTDFQAILALVKTIEAQITDNYDGIVTEMEIKLAGLKTELNPDSKLTNLKQEIQLQLNALNESQVPFHQTLKTLGETVTNLSANLKAGEESQISSLSAQKTELEQKLDRLRSDLSTSIASLGGGSMNRQMFVGGNDPLTKYTDVNFKAGSNVTITTANNNTTKRVDITISATGGGGGAGITRSINSISVDTAAGNSSAVDYVYLVSGTTTLTLPDASANTNLYTIKNVGSGIVTVATTASQTIDGSLTAVLRVQYTAIDVESDGTNWNVT